MVDLAVEELNHYKEVMRLLMAKGVAPAADRKTPTLRAKSTGTKGLCFFADRLLVGAIVERRGAGRFGLVARHIDDTELQSSITPSLKAKPVTGICLSLWHEISAHTFLWMRDSANWLR